MHLQVPQFVALALTQMSLLGEQADLAIPSVDQKLFRIPYYYAIHELILIDFHHVTRPSSSEKISKAK